MCAIYKAAISSSIDNGCINGTEVGPPTFPSTGVSVGPGILTHLLTLEIVWQSYARPNQKEESNKPDDLRALDFSVDPSGPSGMKKATNKAQTTKNEPNTKGGPGSAY